MRRAPSENTLAEPTSSGQAALGVPVLHAARAALLDGARSRTFFYLARNVLSLGDFRTFAWRFTFFRLAISVLSLGINVLSLGIDVLLLGEERTFAWRASLQTLYLHDFRRSQFALHEDMTCHDMKT
jgi:hypothetical protein